MEQERYQPTLAVQQNRTAQQVRIIQLVLEYIEAHLKEERGGVLDNAALARIAGYSEYHFLRLFRQVVHLTPADYIRKRRISEIVRHMGNNRPMADIAFEYGFNSKENFTRAFQKEHHLLPSAFRKADCSLRLFETMRLDSAAPAPTVSIAYREPFSLVAYPFGTAFPPHCWNRYNAEGRSARLSGGEAAEDFGAMVWDNAKGGLTYFIGIHAEAAWGDTAGTVRLDIGGGVYAVFETPPASQHDFVQTIRCTWDWINREWLPGGGYRRADGFELESYVESSRKYSERIYIPITKEE